MGIEDIQISEELETNAPSIKYSGNEGPKSPQEMEQMMMAQLEEEYLKYVDDMMEQGLEPMTLQQFMQQAMAEGDMAGGNPLPEDPTKPVNPFQPKPIGPLPDKREMAAYGGIMGADGRRQYGIGSFFQKYIKDPIEVAFTDETFDSLKERSQKRVDAEDAEYGEGYENPFDTLFKGGRKDPSDPNTERDDTGLNKYIIPAIGGAVAGLFTKKDKDGNTVAASPDETALQLADLKKSANVLGQKEGLAANLNFLPAESARKYSPAEMIEVYQNAANGGRIGFNMGGGADMGSLQMNAAQAKEKMMANIIEQLQSPELNDQDRAILQQQLMGLSPQPQMSMMAMGGRIGFEEGGGIMDLGGMEKDYRAEGGFVPIGREEKADDVPARLSVNEFVFTADAVRNAGGGDIDQGAKVMENMMKHLEQGGQVSEESQGMQGARDMFATSERLSEVI
jgi:hypothetical protein